MINSICREIELQKSFLALEELETIYFGGGTPSILETEEIHDILNTVNKYFSISKNPEITLEANPDDLSLPKVTALKSIGVSRLSIGIQSFEDKLLTFLHRAHNSAEAIACVKNARLAGFTNISIDLIFSIPGQTMDNLNKDVEQALDLNPEHISVYSLTIEDNTVFGNWQKKGKFVQIQDDESAKQFDLIISRLAENGYEQYEISNFCRDENYARHNTSYWKNSNYIGVGPGAHSYNGKIRQFNIPNNHKYMKSIKEGIIPSEIEALDDKSLANEFLLTSLRTKWGCDVNKLKDQFNYDILTIHKKKINIFNEAKLIFLERDFLYLTRKGKFLADEIISDLFWI